MLRVAREHQKSTIVDKKKEVNKKVKKRKTCPRSQ